MKILLDENLPAQLRPMLMPMHDPFTVGFLQWKGVSNGKLLSLAASHGFDALITSDKGIEYQQNQANLPCAVVLIQVADNSIKTIAPLVPRLLKALETLGPRSFMKV